ncbi:MAG: ABC transporter permease [Rubrivirga sp.]
MGLTVLTVLSLALGMAVCLLILTFIWAQKSADRFHTQSDRVVRVLSSEEGGFLLAATPAPLASALALEVPGIEASVRLGQLRSQVLQDGAAIEVTGLYAEPSFFDVFSFEGTGGDPRAVLSEPYQVLLSASAAATIFGTADPIGQTITLEGQGDFVVGGLLAEPPGASHLRFDILASFATLAASDRRADLTDWDNSRSFATYLLLDRPETSARLSDALSAISNRTYAGQDRRLSFQIQPLHDIALGLLISNEISTFSTPLVLVALLAALGLVVMLTAGFNYVSLSTARSIRRAGEIGMRKTLGAGRGQIAAQFLTEAVLIALGALVVTYGLLLWLVPAFNGLAPVQLLGAQISAGHLFDPRLIGLFVAFSVVVGLVAGLYPAAVLARFSPMAALQSRHSTTGFSGKWLRHGLIGAQFALALFFVLTTVLLVAQSRQLLHADYGFETDDLLTLQLQGQDIEVLRNELARYPEIVGVAGTSRLPMSGSTSNVQVSREGMAEPIPTFEYAIEGDALGVLGLDLLAGDALRPGGASDTAQTVLLNESAVRVLGLGTPGDAVGELVEMNERPTEVAGVVKDYHYDILIQPIGPMALVRAPGQIQHALIRARPGASEMALSRVRSAWATLDPARPVEVARFETQLSENPLSQIVGASIRLIGIVAAFAVLISLLGLLGMAAYHVETRVKEVGVRKVLGATRREVVVVLSSTFARIVGVATAVAVPLAWLASERWLELFAIRIEPSPWLLAGCALVMSALALSVVASQALRAAATDPVRALRSD